MSDLAEVVRSIMQREIARQVKEGVACATILITNAIEKEQDRAPVESWMPEPGTCLSDLVGERIREWRKRRGMARRHLAEACAALGVPTMTEAIITNIESGRTTGASRRRLVTVDDLAVLAAALRVSPLVLVEPSKEAKGA